MGRWPQKNKFLENIQVFRESLERAVVIKLTIPLFSSRALNVEYHPGNCSKDWKSDNYKV